MANAGAVIPRQRGGGFSNTESEMSFASVADACNHFERVKERFLNINGWSDISNGLAEFRLTAPDGSPKAKDPEEGDYIRINLPAPPTATSGKYEWVKIEYIVSKKSIMSDYESVAILVRPAESPVDSEKGTAHFFKKDATSTFMVRRDNTTITAEVHGRNEKPNTDVTYLFDMLRNIFLSIGAILGFSKVQWKSLVNGLIGGEKEDTGA